jgi:fructokinase
MTRIGVDLGGTKIEAAALADDGRIVARLRRPTPDTYDEALIAIAGLADDIERELGCARIDRLGVGMPGCVSRRTGTVRNASALWLNDRPFREDLEKAADRKVQVANDANCFALSEATDGAAGGAEVVLGVILGTGCGAGLVVRGSLIEGASRLAGEIGHTPLPWPSAVERASRLCWCGRTDCLEAYVSGPAFQRDYLEETGATASPAEIILRLRAGEAAAATTFARYVDRLARGLAAACGLLDPDVVVLGGGMSKTHEIYEQLPRALDALAGDEALYTRIVPAAHGDASGVRGAAWLWGRPQ